MKLVVQNKKMNNFETKIPEILDFISQGSHSAAIVLLEKTLSQSPRDSQIHYLLGAEYAQIGEYEKAITEMTEAITLNPNLHTAVFQLGLLYLTQGQPNEAIQTWLPLASLSEDDSLRLFSLGLEYLAKDEFNQCKELLETGIQNNQSNPALNADMQRILSEVAELSNKPTEPQSILAKETVCIYKFTIKIQMRMTTLRYIDNA